MKYYNHGLYDKEEFVKYYEINDNEIIVTNGKNKQYIVENNENNICTLNKKIKNQILYNDITEHNVKSTKKKLIVYGAISLASILSCILISIFTTEVTLVSRIVGYITGFFLGKVFVETTSLIYSSKRLKEKRKQQLFLANKDILNNQNTNVLSLGKISKKSEQELYDYLKSGKEPFNIKTVHKLKYRELKGILESLKYQQINNDNFTSDKNNEESKKELVKKI